MRTLRALLLTLRPHQWVKNLFVAAPLVFAKRLTDGHAALLAGLAVLAFCALSGAVYALNDVLDAERDRAHPTKKNRPIAAGLLSERAAVIAGVVLAAAALTVAAAIRLRFAAVAGAYLALNLLYSLHIKDFAFIDVTAIAIGFLLRVLGGAYAIDVPPSPWLLACTLLLAAFLGLGKRAHELALVQDRGGAITRAVLAKYDSGHLKAALYVTGLLTTVAYAFYTQAGHTVAFFGTRRMIWTAPFCLVGIARFLALSTRRGRGDGPTEEMLRDAPFMINLAAWAATVLVIIYLR